MIRDNNNSLEEQIMSTTITPTFPKVVESKAQEQPAPVEEPQDNAASDGAAGTKAM